MFEDLQLGQSAQTVKTITADNVRAFAEVSGDHNPVHLDPEHAAKTMFKVCIVHGGLMGSLISGLVSKELPGSIVRSMELDFLRPVPVGSTVTSQFEIVELEPRRGFVTLACASIVNGKKAIKGQVKILVLKRESKAEEKIE